MNEKYKQELNIYLKNPNVCKYCNNEILITEKRGLRKTKNLYFCSISCGVSFNNRFKNSRRSKDKFDLLRLIEFNESCIEQTDSFPILIHNGKILSIDNKTEGIERDKMVLIVKLKKETNSNKKKLKLTTHTKKILNKNNIKLLSMKIHRDCILHGSNKTIRCKGLQALCKYYTECLDIAIDNNWSGWTSEQINKAS